MGIERVEEERGRGLNGVACAMNTLLLLPLPHTHFICEGNLHILASHCLHLNEDKSQAQIARHKFSRLISKIDKIEMAKGLTVQLHLLLLSIHAIP